MFKKNIENIQILRNKVKKEGIKVISPDDNSEEANFLKHALGYEEEIENKLNKNGGAITKTEANNLEDKVVEVNTLKKTIVDKTDKK